MTLETQVDGAATAKRKEQRESVVIRFAGDSGDGMQLTGMQFTTESALAGNDIGTLPDYPAEIRAPAGTLAGVSGFQLNFSSLDIYTPGDNPDVLVVMNPAALKVNIADLKAGGLLLADRDGFDEGNLKKAGYTGNPLEDGSLDKYQVVDGGHDGHDLADAGGSQAVEQGRHPLQELLRPRPVLVAVQPTGRADHQVDSGQVQEDPRACRGQYARPQGGLPLRRNDRDVRGAV